MSKSNLVDKDFQELASDGLTGKTLAGHDTSATITEVWILSSAVTPQPGDTVGVWNDASLWSDTNVWYD